MKAARNQHVHVSPLGTAAQPQPQLDRPKNYRTLLEHQPVNVESNVTNSNRLIWTQMDDDRPVRAQQEALKRVVCCDFVIFQIHSISGSVFGEEPNLVQIDQHKSFPAFKPEGTIVMFRYDKTRVCHIPLYRNKVSMVLTFSGSVVPVRSDCILFRDEPDD